MAYLDNMTDKVSDNIPDTSNPMKVVIFAEADRDNISFLNGLPYNDPTVTKFPTQALNFTEDNPIIGGRAVEYLVVVGSGKGQVENAFKQVSNAKDRNGNPFVQDGTELIVMGHADPGSAKAGSGGYYGTVSPAGWKTIIQDAGLYDKFKTVNYGSCQMGEELACVNLSYAFGTDTKVIAQTDFRWGQGSSPAAMYGDDWSKTKLYKDPALEGGTVADALHSVGAGQVEITGYDRKQIRYNKGKAPFKLDGNQQFKDIGFGERIVNQEDLAAYDEARLQVMTESPALAEMRENIPIVGEEPEYTGLDPWTGDVTSTASQNVAHTRARAMNYMQKQFWDEEYGEYDESGNLIGHTSPLPDMTPDFYGRAGADTYNFNEEDKEKYEDWVANKDKQTETLEHLVSYADFYDEPGDGFQFTKNDDGTLTVTLPNAAAWTLKKQAEEGTGPEGRRNSLGNMMVNELGWTINDDGTVRITDIDIPYELDTEGRELPLMQTIKHHGSNEDPQQYQYLRGYEDWLTQAKHGGQMNQLRTFQYGPEWDAYRESESLYGRYIGQMQDVAEVHLLTEEGITRPIPQWEGGMLLDSDDMIPPASELIKTPGVETDMLVNSMRGDDSLGIDKRVDAIWSQYKNRNPQALEAFNTASETLEGLGVEANTPYWDKLIGLEALRLYAESDE